MRKSKTAGLVLFYAIYALTYLAAYFIGRALEPLLLRVFVMDVAATVLIWLISLLLKNSSLYDAYWSLTPMVILLYVLPMYYVNLNIYHWIFLAVFFLWSVRLTWNWSVTFENMDWEDWRYRKFRELPPVLWHLANFFGIMMVPTLFVFAGMLPLFFFLTIPAAPASLAGSLIVAVGILLETAADRQMHAFLRSAPGRAVCRAGLWRWSRHPNYLGEILIWVGVYAAAVLSDSRFWYLLLGVAVMVFLFLVISIPMAEKHHMERREDYVNYRRETSRLLLIPPGWVHKA